MLTSVLRSTGHSVLSMYFAGMYQAVAESACHVVERTNGTYKAWHRLCGFGIPNIRFSDVPLN